MLFNINEISKLFNIIDYRVARILIDVLGKENITEEDKRILLSYDFDIDKAVENISPFWQSYLFGQIAGILTPGQIKRVDYKDLESYIEKKQYRKPTEREYGEYRAAALKTYSHIKGLGTRFKETLTTSISNSENQSVLLAKKKEVAIKKELITGTIEKKSVQSIVSDIGHKVDEWNRDWGRIVETELQDIFSLGAAHEIAERHGISAKVFKDTYSGACRHCLKFYTTAGAGSKPRVFELSSLIANGSNVGKKVSEWLPTIGPVHPFCYDDKTEVLTKTGFKFFKDVNIEEDEFLSLNIETKEGEYKKAIGKVDQEYNGEMIYRNNKNFDLCTTPNHYHVINDSKSKNIRLVEELKLPKYSNFMCTIPKWEGKHIDFFEFDGIKYKANDFCEFMGFFISEGNLKKYNKECKHSNVKVISISQSKKNFYEDIYNNAIKLFPKAYRLKDKIEIPIKGRIELWNYLNLGKSFEKYVPQNIKELTPELIEYFLDSFRKGDGNIYKGRVWDGYQCNSYRFFYTSSKQIADDLGEMIIKIGKRPSFKTKEIQTIYDKKQDKFYTQNNPIIVISELSNKRAYRPKVKESIIQYSGRIYDVELEENHTLVVKRNGRVCISGNCRCNLRYLPEGYEWNESLKVFAPKEYKRKIERKSKVRITIGTKEFEV